MAVDDETVNESPFKNKTIVIVEDFETTQSKLKNIYEAMGFKVLKSFENGLLAYDWISEQKKAPDFTSIDIIMPVMNGIELYDRLRAHKIDTCSFFVSCLSAEDNFVKSISGRYPPERFIAKNFEVDFFKIRLNNLLKSIQATAVEG